MKITSDDASDAASVCDAIATSDESNADDQKKKISSILCPP
jgi:hypothetical protein